MNDDNYFRFDLWLYNEMKKRSLTISDLAERVGVSERSICYYLRNQVMPSWRTLEDILKAFDMHLEIVTD